MLLKYRTLTILFTIDTYDIRLNVVYLIETEIFRYQIDIFEILETLITAVLYIIIIYKYEEVLFFWFTDIGIKCYLPETSNQETIIYYCMFNSATYILLFESLDSGVLKYCYLV